ncbi:unnamed protein product [Sphagnum jensenii]
MLLLATALVGYAQTHTFPAEDTNNAFTGVNSFSHINSTLYIDSVAGQLPTIQSGITTACSLGGKTVVDIPASSTPADVISAVTGGCSNAGIVDERTLPFNYYTWNGTAYVLVSSGGGGVQFNPSITQSIQQPSGTYLGANNLENIRFVDPTAATGYTTISAAIASLPTIGNQGGVIYVQPGTYAGPTTIPSGVRIVSLGGLYPPNVFTQFNGSAFNSYSPGPTSAALTIFQYTAPLTISDVNRIAISGIILDFQNSGNLTIRGVSLSEFDIAVVNTSITAPAVVLDADTANNYGSGFNHFKNLITQGGNAGVQFGNSTVGGLFFTENTFDSIHVMTSTQSSGTFTVLNFLGNCDSNVIHKASLWATTAVTNINGVVFGSSTTADTDADLIKVEWYDETLAAARTGGHAIVVNYSTNNSISTGVIGPGTDGLYAYYPDAGSLPYNSPWIQWNNLGTGTPNPYGAFSQFPAVIADDGAEGTPAFGFHYGGQNVAQFYGGTGLSSGHVYFYGKAFNSGAGGNIDDWNLVSGTLAHHSLFQTDVLGVDPGEGGTVTTANYAAQTILTNTSPGGSAAQTLKIQAGQGQSGNDAFNYYNYAGTTKLANIDSAGNFFGQNVTGLVFTATTYNADNGAAATGYSYKRSGALKYQTQLGADGNFYLYGGSAGVTQLDQISSAGQHIYVGGIAITPAGGSNKWSVDTSGNMSVGGVINEYNGTNYSLTHSSSLLTANRTLSFPDANVYLGVFGASGSSHSTGTVPDPGATAGTTHYLREDGTWQVPSGGAVTSVFGRTGAVVAASGDYTAAQVGADTVGAAAAVQTAVQGAIQQNAYIYATDTGAANAYAVALSPVPTVIAGSNVLVKVANTSTGASTLAVNGTVTAIRKKTSAGIAAIAAGDLVAGQVYRFDFDGTYWQTSGSAAQTSAQIATALNGGTAPTAAQVPFGQVSGNVTFQTISGDMTCVATGACTNVGINGQAVPASAVLTGTDSSGHFVAKTVGPTGAADAPGAAGTTAVTVTIAASNSPKASLANVQCTGTADQTCINTAITANCPLSGVSTNVPGCKILFMPGIYKLTGSVVIPTDDITLEGIGHCMWGGANGAWSSTNPSGTIGYGCAQLQMQAAGSGLDVITITPTTPCGNGTETTRCRGIQIENLYLVGYNFLGNGISSNTATDNMKINDNVIQNTLNGIYMTADSPVISGNSIQDIAGDAIVQTTTNAFLWSIHDNLIYDNGGICFRGQGTAANFHHNRCGDVSGGVVTSGSNTIVDANEFVGISGSAMTFTGVRGGTFNNNVVDLFNNQWIFNLHTQQVTNAQAVYCSTASSGIIANGNRFDTEILTTAPAIDFTNCANSNAIGDVIFGPWGVASTPVVTGTASQTANNNTNFTAGTGPATVTSAYLMFAYVASNIAQANGSTVTTWPDTSGITATGVGNNLIGVGTPIYETASLVNSHPAVRFNNSANYMNCAYCGSSQYIQGRTLFEVFNYTAAPTGSNLAALWDIGFGAGAVYINTTNHICVYAGSTVCTTAALTVGNNYIVEYTINGASSRISINGTLQTVNPGTTVSYGRTNIGGNGTAGNAFTGDVAEADMYFQSMSQADAASVAAALSTTYGITITTGSANW